MNITINNLTKRFNQVTAVQKVDLLLDEGLHGLLGPNGAGKTTLMRMLVGILTPDEGEIACDGTEIAKMGAQYRDLLGYLPQQFAMYEDFTGERFLRYVSDLKGIDRISAKKRIGECLEIVGMVGDEKKKIRKMSGGMRRRIGIAQALLNDPKVLVLDEPTSGLDPSERIRLRNYLLDIARDRVVLLSTHIVADLEAAAQHIILMKKGQVIEDSTPGELLKQMRDKVYVLRCETEALPELQRRYTVSSIQRVEELNEIRIVGDVPPENAVSVAPRLEDVYMYHYGNV